MYDYFTNEITLTFLIIVWRFSFSERRVGKQGVILNVKYLERFAPAEKYQRIRGGDPRVRVALDAARVPPLPPAGGQADIQRLVLGCIDEFFIKSIGF